MAGPSIGTWVKVRNKSGKTTARVIANKFGGGSYEQGEVISQSEYNQYKENRQSTMKAEGSGGSGGSGGKLPKAALSKDKKREIMDRNLEGMIGKQIRNQDQARIKQNRLDRKKREVRRKYNPDAPAFTRARKAAETRKGRNGQADTNKVASRKLPKAALSKDKKREIMDRNLEGMIGKQIRNQDQARIKQNRLDRKKREVRRKYNPDAPAFTRARKAAETRKVRK